MAEKEELQGKLSELQLLQQKLTFFSTQKQQLQLQLVELEHALKELEKAKEGTYQLVGEILIEKSPESLKIELNSKKEEIDLRIKMIEKQETKLKEKLQELQKELLAKIK
ncbi:MAG: prefoldin subunit [Candidatus Nanoarchaeia archaeon]